MLKNQNQSFLAEFTGVNLKGIWQKYSKSMVTAESGKNSKPMQIYGNSGEDKIVPVPVGVTIYDDFMRKIGW